MKFTVVLPIIFKDKQFLSFTLGRIYELNPDEVLLVFNKSDPIIGYTQALIRKYSREGTTRFIETEHGADWSSQIAYSRQTGFMLAKNDIVINLDADTLVDLHIKDYLDLLGKNGVGMISFARVEYPLCYQYFVRRLLLATHLEEPFSPIYAFHKKVLLDREDQNTLKTLDGSEDVYIHKAISRKYKILYIDSECIHLKPERNQTRKYRDGRTVWQANHGSLLRVLARAIIYLDVNGFIGYVHERWHPSHN